jgi:hypothetical protein
LPRSRINRLNSGLGELARQGGGHHAVLCLPRAPIDREHAAGPPRVEPQGELIEDLIGGRVVGLAAVSIARRNRREEDQES